MTTPNLKTQKTGQVEETNQIINVGSRKSELALIQTHGVIDKLKNFYINNSAYIEDNPNFGVVAMTTTGDEILGKPLHTIEAKSLFTRELEVELLEGRVDFVVHSLKDLPTTLPDGCTIGAVLMRDDPNDAIILRKSLVGKVDPIDLLLGKAKASDGSNFKIGTSSQRRLAMIKRYNQTIQCADIRGNLNTRFAKLDKDEGEYSAIILASAGLDRMGWSERATSILSPENSKEHFNWFYAVGQGAIAVECRSNDLKTLSILATLCDLKTTYEVIAERTLMKKLESGCSAPLGVRSTWSKDENKDVLNLVGIVLSLDGQSIVQVEESVALEAEAEGSQIDGDEYFEFETNITLTSKKMVTCQVKQNLIRCSNLGLDVARKIIEMGGLELINQAK